MIYPGGVPTLPRYKLCAEIISFAIESPTLAASIGRQSIKNNPAARNVQGKVIIPGLIDTHVHVAQSLIRGCADDKALIQWLCERVWVLQGNFTEDDGYVSARLCIAEMLKSGTTTFLESMLAHRYGFNGIARAVEESGVRACLAGIVMDIGTYATQSSSMHPGLIEDRETSLLGVLDMHSKWQGAANDRIHVWFGPRTPGGVTPELYREILK